MLINEKIKTTNFQYKFSIFDVLISSQNSNFYHDQIVNRLIVVNLLKEYFKKNLINVNIKYIDVSSIIHSMRAKSLQFHEIIDRIINQKSSRYYYNYYEYCNLTTWEIHNIYQFLNKREKIFQKIADHENINVNVVRKYELSILIFIILNFDKLIKDIIYERKDIQIVNF